MSKWLIVVLLILTIPLWFPVMLVGEIISLCTKKCKHRKYCNIYKKDDHTCNETGGEFYGAGRYAGCYRSLEEFGKESKYWKD